MLNRPIYRRPPLALSEFVHNVAIGSNMDGAKLRTRNVGDHRRIAPIGAGVPCCVPGWSLSFDYVVLPPLEPVMAGAVERAGSELHGVLWKLNSYDYDLLACTEYCTTSDSTYVERQVLAYPYGGGAPVSALIFALRHQPLNLPQHLYPSKRYLTMMVLGSRDAGLDSTVVEQLNSMPTSRECHWCVRALALFAMLAMYLTYNRAPLLYVLRYWYRPLLAWLYSYREQAATEGCNTRATIVTTLLCCVLWPLTFVGFFRALYLRRNIRKLMKGERDW